MISIIIPTLNEVENIPLVLRLIEAAWTEKTFQYEIIFVDDKSTDGTQDAILEKKRAGLPIQLLISAERKGLGNALKLGMAAASGDCTLFLDCDVSIDANDLLKLISQASRTRMVIGSRYCRGGKTIGAPPVKVFLSKCLNFLVSKYLGVGVFDISHSLRVFPTGAVSYPLSNSHPAFFWELSLIAKIQGLERLEIPVTFRERTRGRSKNTTGKMVRSVLNGLRKVIELKRQIR